MDSACQRVYTSRMNTLNIEALQKTQTSIANQTIAFNMRSWTSCICEHARRANGWGDIGPELVAALLGVNRHLFQCRPTDESNRDRDLAIARIQALIDDAMPTPPEPEPEPRPEPEPEPELLCA